KGDNQSGDSYITYSGSIEYSNADKLILEVGYFLATDRDNYPYVNLQWSFKLGSNTYLDVNGNWQEGASEEVKNVLFVNSFNSDEKLAFNINFPASQKTPVSTTFELKLYYVDVLYHDLEADIIANALKQVPA